MDIDTVKVKKLTSEEQKECFKKGLCLQCRKKGHMANACPTFSDPLKKPQVQHAQKEEKLPELKEVEDDDREEGVAWVSLGWTRIFKWETHFDAELSLSSNMRSYTCIHFKQIYAYPSTVDHPLVHSQSRQLLHTGRVQCRYLLHRLAICQKTSTPYRKTCLPHCCL